MDFFTVLGTKLIMVILYLLAKLELIESLNKLQSPSFTNCYPCSIMYFRTVPIV